MSPKHRTNSTRAGAFAIGLFAAVAALAAPTWAADVCGDTVVTGNEQCDDGNLIDGDGCQATCRLPLGKPGDFASDDFNTCGLDARWEVFKPMGSGSVDVSGAGTGDARLELRVPAGIAHDAWAPGSNNSVRAMQVLTDEPGDLELQAKFDSEPTGNYTDQGLLFEQDELNFIRFDVFHSGTSLNAFGGRTVGGTHMMGFNVPVNAGMGHHMRVTRGSDRWTLWLSADGTSWKEVGSLTHALTIERLGVFVGNPVNAAEYEADVDFVFNVADPVIPEDGAALNCGCIDNDGDGYGEGDSCLGADCNDDDPEIHPLATDTCDGQDNDCNGTVDDELDADGDGFSSCQGDCDDGDAEVLAGNPEICDGIDNDCNGFIDDGLTSLNLWVKLHRLDGDSRYRQPYAGARVVVYDRGKGSCVRETCGPSANEYACVVANCAPATLAGTGAPAEGTTDEGGGISFELAPGDYVAIVDDGATVHHGKVIDGLECGEERIERLRVVVTPSRRSNLRNPELNLSAR